MVPGSLEESVQSIYGDPEAMRRIAISNAAAKDMIDISKHVGYAWKWSLGGAAIIGGLSVAAGAVMEKSSAMVAGAGILGAAAAAGTYVAHRRYKTDLAAMWHSAWYLPARR